MSDVQDTTAEEATPTSRGLWRSAVDRAGGWGLLLGLPGLILLVALGWLAWRTNAQLDSIEARQLAWPTLAKLWQQHLMLTLVSSLCVVGTAIPAGILLTRPGLRRWSGPVVAVANMGQSAPVIGVIVLLAIWLGFGFWTAVLALTIYAFLPVLANTITGLRGVDRSLVEASRGMGNTQLQTLVKVELPLAMPVIMTGVRTALVLLVGSASFGTFINAGGLGALITTGINLFRFNIIVSGALMVAVLALFVDWFARVLEAIATPKGL